jgi:hypothetical protein
VTGRVRVNGAFVIKSAESRPRPVVPRERDVSPPAVTDADRALVAAVLEHRRRSCATR